MNERLTCPQFQTHMERLNLKSDSAMLPVRRCLLSERMITLLRDTPEAEGVLKAIVLDAEAEMPYCLYGPDLDAIEHSKCTALRCGSSCSPSYRGILGRFEITDSQEIDCGAVVPAPDQSQSSGA